MRLKSWSKIQEMLQNLLRICKNVAKIAQKFRVLLKNGLGIQGKFFNNEILTGMYRIWPGCGTKLQPVFSPFLDEIHNPTKFLTNFLCFLNLLQFFMFFMFFIPVKEGIQPNPLQIFYVFQICYKLIFKSVTNLFFIPV